MNKRKKVLVIDDEKDILEFVRFNLEQENFDVISSIDGLQGLNLVREQHPDIIILDLMLPNIDGLDICKIIKNDSKISTIPIIMLSAKSAESDIVIGLELGADDYMTKPFSVKELIARIKVNLRKSQNIQNDKLIKCGDFQLNINQRVCLFKGKQMDLTFLEFEVLKLLMSHPGWVFSRSQIMNATRDGAYAVTERTIDVQILNLRKKLDGDYIKTVRGAGYKFED